MGVKDHKCHAVENVRCAVLTVSDTRVKDTDDSGSIIVELLRSDRHIVSHYDVIKDEKEMIKGNISHLLSNPNIQAIIINGGTGVGKRDVTVDVITHLLEKKLEGFGELFRALSFQEIGSAAMLSRAIAGVVKGKVVFCLPGSPNACTLAMKKLIIPELGHIVWEANR